MHMELTKDEQELIECYRETSDINRDHLRWLAKILARASKSIPSRRVT
jgi:hypothetical protein